MAIMKKSKCLSGGNKRKCYPIKERVKKVDIDFCGTCELRQLQSGTYFRTVDKNGKVSKETYTKQWYDRSSKKFICDKHSDVWGNGRLLKGSQKVTTDFIY